MAEASHPLDLIERLGVALDHATLLTGMRQFGLCTFLHLQLEIREHVLLALRSELRLEGVEDPARLPCLHADDLGNAVAEGDPGSRSSSSGQIL